MGSKNCVTTITSFSKVYILIASIKLNKHTHYTVIAMNIHEYIFLVPNIYRSFSKWWKDPYSDICLYT